MNNRNIDIIEHIIRYCGEIREARERFGDSFESLQSDTLYKNAVAMSILQIGELSARLSDDFKSAYNEMPWRDIKNMRNIAAHHYSKFDITINLRFMEKRTGTNVKN